MKKGSRRKRSHDAETHAVAPIAGRRAETRGRAQLPRGVGPGAPAENAPAAISARPRRTIRGRSQVTVMIAILGPLRRIAEHVVEAVSVRQKASDRRRKHITVAAWRDRPALGAVETALRG